jgi:fructosamine-3-kinase
MEFGITTLFGGLSPRAWAAYLEAWPLAAGWRERNPLYQLYHLLNHALLFGGGYLAQAEAVARRYA